MSYNFRAFFLEVHDELVDSDIDLYIQFIPDDEDKVLMVAIKERKDNPTLFVADYFLLSRKYSQHDVDLQVRTIVLAFERAQQDGR